MNIKEQQERFLRLLEPLNDQLFLYARALERNKQDAEDLVSETILKCYEYFPNIKDESAFKGYLFIVARNIFRKKYRRSLLFGKFDDSFAENIPDNNSSPDLPIDIAFLYQALDKLPAKQKESIVLFDISGFSLNEIKEIQGGTLSAVKSRLKRGRERLIEILNPEKSYQKFNFSNNAIVEL